MQCTWSHPCRRVLGVRSKTNGAKKMHQTKCSLRFTWCEATPGPFRIFDAYHRRACNTCTFGANEEEMKWCGEAYAGGKGMYLLHQRCWSHPGMHRRCKEQRTPQVHLEEVKRWGVVKRAEGMQYTGGHTASLVPVHLCTEGHATHAPSVQVKKK